MGYSTIIFINKTMEHRCTQQMEVSVLAWGCPSYHPVVIPVSRVKKGLLSICIYNSELTPDGALVQTSKLAISWYFLPFHFLPSHFPQKNYRRSHAGAPAGTLKWALNCRSISNARRDDVVATRGARNFRCFSG